jgi:hypothetical protein
MLANMWFVFWVLFIWVYLSFVLNLSGLCFLQDVSKAKAVTISISVMSLGSSETALT